MRRRCRCRLLDRPRAPAKTRPPCRRCPPPLPRWPQQSRRSRRQRTARLPRPARPPWRGPSPAAPRLLLPRSLRRARRSLRRRCPEASAPRQLLCGELFYVSSGRALHLRGSLAGSLQEWFHFGRPADDLRRGHLVWRRAQSGRPPLNPQSSVEPVLAAPQGVEGPTLREALAGCCGSCSSSGSDRLSRLNA